MSTGLKTALIIGAVALTASVVGTVAVVVQRNADDDGILPGLERWRDGALPLRVNSGRLSPEVKRGAERAVGFWRSEVGTFTFAAPGEISGSEVLLVEADVDDLAWDEEHTIARADLKIQGGIIHAARIRVNIALAHTLSPEKLKRAVAHELGHVLGLAHDGMRDSIMYDRLSSVGYDVLESDKDLLRELYE